MTYSFSMLLIIAAGAIVLITYLMITRDPKPGEESVRDCDFAWKATHSLSFGTIVTLLSSF